MGLFDDISKFVTTKNKLAKKTGGILSENSLILDGDTGNLHARANIPIVSLTPTVSEKYDKAQNFAAGIRGTITDPVDPTKTDVYGTVPSKVPSTESEIESGTGTYPPSSPDYLSEIQSSQRASEGQTEAHQGLLNPYLRRPLSTGQVPSQAEEDISAANQTGEGTGYRSTLRYMQGIAGSPNPYRTGQVPTSNTADALVADESGRTPSESINDRSRTGKGRPQDVVDEDLLTTGERLEKTLPESAAKNSPKWKDILVSVLQNISQTDFSKYSPDQQLSALIGAAGGGAIRGAATGRYAGKVDLANQNRKIDQRNAARMDKENAMLTLKGKRADVISKQQEPELKRLETDLKYQTEARREAEASYKQSKGERDAEDRMKRFLMSEAGKDSRLEKTLNGVSETRTKYDEKSGNYYLTLINKKGQEMTISTLDGTGQIRVADPTEIARFNADDRYRRDVADNEGEIAAASVKPPTEAERNRMIDEEARRLAPNIDSLGTSRKDAKIKADIRSRAAAIVDRRLEGETKRRQNQARSTRKGQVYKRQGRPSGSSSGAKVPSLQGIDFKTLFNNRQQR